ncbi:MAG: DUF2520 domain-containing protein [Cyclobacteriaceae bacterium]
MNNPQIAIVGFGNVGFHLTKRLFEIGIPPCLICTRDAKKTQNLLDQIGIQSPVTSDKDLSQSALDFVILTVSDTAISDIIANYRFPKNAIIIHTSGSQPLEILAQFEQHGVMYPIQTFSLAKSVNFEKVPILIEGNSENTEIAVEEFASLLSSSIRHASSEERLKVHMAAVIACNFSNKLYEIAEDILRDTSIDLADLQPLLEETVRKAVSLGANQAQTGPAARGDSNIISKHLDSLKDEPEILRIYKMMTQAIQKSNL